MNARQSTGIAALGTAATYFVGFSFLFTVLLPAGYGMDPTKAPDAIAFLTQHSAMLIAWNSVIYIVNAICLAVLVAGLHRMLSPKAPPLMAIASLFGAIWVGLLLAAGMVANSAVVVVAALGNADPERAALVWQVLRAVENGLGGGNEIAGALWIGMSMTFVPSGPILVRALSAIAGAAGLLTLVPALSEPMGAAFGLLTLAWFLGLGITLLRAGQRQAAPF